jgi:hypothetical protein
MTKNNNKDLNKENAIIKTSNELKEEIIISHLLNIK